MVQIKLKCQYCDNIHDGSYGSGRFCSQKCARGFSSLEKRKEISDKVSLKLGGKGKNRFVGSGKCIGCGKDISKRKKYCSWDCHVNDNYLKYIKDWKDGKKDGAKGLTKEFLSGHIRRYLFEKHNGKCCKCGWCQINENTGKVPLQINHIDGNYLNNKEDNLELICPNCHSLTDNYMILNKGKGRNKEREREKMKLFSKLIVKE